MSTNLIDVSESCSCTDAKLIHFSHYWTIDHFSHYLGREETLQSARFTSPTNETLRFYIAMFIKDKDEDIGICLYLESAGERKDLTVNYKISIEYSDGLLYNMGGL